jgi:hypothetical protein
VVNDSYTILGMLLAAVAIAWCVMLFRRIFNRRIRMLTMLLTALGICQAMRTVDRVRLFGFELTVPFGHALDVMMGVVALAAIALLQLHDHEQRSTSMQLRLAEAERAEVTLDSEPLLPPNTRLAAGTHGAAPPPQQTPING